MEKPPFQTIAQIQRKLALGGLTEGEIEDLWDSVFLTLPEIDELLEHVRQHAMHPFIYPFFCFAAHTGARKSEIRRSRIHDVELDASRVLIRERKRVRGRHTTRPVPLSPFLAGVLRQWFAEHPGGVYTFPIDVDVPHSRKRRATPQPLTCEEASHHFRQTLLGSKWEKLRGWHVFRHSFCSNCAAAGADQRIIDAWVGHQTDEMRRRYRHLIPSQEHAEIERIFASSAAAPGLRIHDAHDQEVDRNQASGEAASPSAPGSPLQKRLVAGR
jgi:integrase